MKSGIELMTDERMRQVEKEGWTPEHDDAHDDGELATAAECYLRRDDVVLTDVPLNSARGIDENCYHYDYPAPKPGQIAWPWDAERWKPSDDSIRNLVKAGALIAAEIDRLQRDERATRERRVQASRNAANERARRPTP